MILTWHKNNCFFFQRIDEATRENNQESLGGVLKLHWQDFANYGPPTFDICEEISLLNKEESE